jgi:hypothetical protein
LLHVSIYAYVILLFYRTGVIPKVRITYSNFFWLVFGLSGRQQVVGISRNVLVVLSKQLFAQFRRNELSAFCSEESEIIDNVLLRLSGVDAHEPEAKALFFFFHSSLSRRSYKDLFPKTTLFKSKFGKNSIVSEKI